MVVAFIPARGGSERIPKKNLRGLRGHPLLAYAIAGAKRAGIFDGGIYVSTEDREVAKVARQYGAQVIKRPASISGNTSTDLEWIRHALIVVPKAEECVLLRPTNPLRTAETILRAWKVWKDNQPSDSLRAVREVTESPWKMWYAPYIDVAVQRIERLMYQHHVDYHDMPTQAAPQSYIQSGCIQIFTRRLVEDWHTQTGAEVVPFITNGPEGLDINGEEDWDMAEILIQRGIAKLEVIA
jgi:CMP-N,N'-diacetyllegionaminic acid synthase